MGFSGEVLAFLYGMVIFMDSNELTEIGLIIKPFGIKGEVKVLPLCDNIDVFLDVEIFYIDGNVMEYEDMKAHKGSINLKIKGVDSVDDAEKLRNRTIFTEKKNIPLKKGQFFINDLLKSEVIDFETKRVYGILKEIDNNGGKDVYTIETKDGKILLFPAIPEVIKKVDIENKKIEITPLKGLFDI